MLFNSYSFLFCYLPLTVLVFWVLVRKHVFAAICFLALDSYFFYLYGETTYPWMLLGSILFNYLCGLCIRKSLGPWPRFFLWLGLVCDLSLLGVYKYSNFFWDQLGNAVLLKPHAVIALPVGISFYTFTQIAYLVDTYRESDSESNFVRYCLFISYFPHLIAGPILHHKEMMPQFLQPNLKKRLLALYPGLCLFSIGLAKKVLIADPCGQVASNLFGLAIHGYKIGFVDGWFAALFYSVQIYFDFSGYSDMALAISFMLGIRLPVNFNSPYKAKSIIDFWRRWHISLSRFLRDYVYFTLGGNRRGPRRQQVNLVLTMVVGGLWHGAGWGFLLWGTLHGMMLLVAHIWRTIAKSRPSLVLPEPFAWTLTFLFVVFAWVPFRTTGFVATLNVWGGMLGLHGLQLPDMAILRIMGTKLRLPLHPSSYHLHEIPILVLALLIVFVAPNSQEILGRFHVGLDSPGYHALPTGKRGMFEVEFNVKTALAIGLLLALSARSIGSYSEFIYFHF